MQFSSRLDCDWDVLWCQSVDDLPKKIPRTSDSPNLELVSTIPLRPSDDSSRPKVAGIYVQPESLLRLARWTDRNRFTATVVQANLADQDELSPLATRVMVCAGGSVRTLTWNGRRPLDRTAANSLASGLRQTTMNQKRAPVLSLPAIDFHRCEAFTVEAVVEGYTGPVCSQGVGRSTFDPLFWTAIHTNPHLTIHGIGWEETAHKVATRTSLGSRRFTGHFAVVWDSGVYSVFANGVLVRIGEASGPAAFNDAHRFLVGAIKRLDIVDFGPTRLIPGAGTIRELMVSAVARYTADKSQLKAKVVPAEATVTSGRRHDPTRQDHSR